MGWDDGKQHGMGQTDQEWGADSQSSSAWQGGSSFAASRRVQDVHMSSVVLLVASI